MVIGTLCRHLFNRKTSTQHIGLQLAAEVHAQHYSGSAYSLVEPLQRHMQALGLEVFTSDAGVANPGFAGRRNSSNRCVNLHAIQRSLTGDGKEAIVLVTPAALTRGEAGVGMG